MIPVVLPHGYGVPSFVHLEEPDEPETKAAPTVDYEGPCDVCGEIAPWRTVLEETHRQVTYCDCPCLEAVAA